MLADSPELTYEVEFALILPSDDHELPFQRYGVKPDSLLDKSLQLRVMLELDVAAADWLPGAAGLLTVLRWSME